MSLSSMYVRILDIFSPFPTSLCHVIYYHGDKKIPCLVGIGLSVFVCHAKGVRCNLIRWVEMLWDGQHIPTYLVVLR